MKWASALVIAATLAAATPARAQNDWVEPLLWDLCPTLLGTAAEVALKRLSLGPRDVEAIAEAACYLAEGYRKAASRPQAVPDTRTAEEIFCEGSSLEACAGVPGSASMSPGMRCVLAGLSLDGCLVQFIEAEGARR